MGVNDSGQVAGVGNNGTGNQAFIGTPSGSAPIPYPSGWITGIGQAVNNSGQVAGFGYSGTTTQAFIGTVSGSTAIPLPNGWTTAYGYAVNNAGLVDGNNTLVGATGIAFQAFVGTAAGSIAIPLPPGATIAYVQAGSINDSGFVVGTSDAGGWTWSASNGTVLLSYRQAGLYRARSVSATMA
jgi:hypothetical protein